MNEVLSTIFWSNDVNICTFLNFTQVQSGLMFARRSLQRGVWRSRSVFALDGLILRRVAPNQSRMNAASFGSRGHR